MDLTAAPVRKGTSPKALSDNARDETWDAQTSWLARDQAERAAERSALSWLVFFGWIAMTALVFLAVVFL